MKRQKISGEQLTGFESLLASIHIDSLSATPYAKRYLQHILAHKKFYIHLYAHLLELAITNCNKAKKDICLVDYGAGNGLMGLFAKYCGFGKVYINDLSNDFLHAAIAVSDAVQISPDGFITGDIENVQAYFGQLPLDVIVGTDVIEHIYNLDHFFATVKKINPYMITVMNTASNPVNPFRIRQLKAMQLKDEFEGGTPDDRVLFGAVEHASFIELRKRIISLISNGNLTAEEEVKLATLTRGLYKTDIEKAVQKYIAEKKWPVALSHPTNTCDPTTGSWTERMLSFEEYKTIYGNAGFSVEVHDGFYNAFEPTLKSKLLFFANLIIPFAAHKLSQSITLVGKPV